MSHNVAEECDVERLEQATDNSSNSQETFVKRVASSLLMAQDRGIHSAHTCTVSKSCCDNQNANIILERTCRIRCGSIKSTKVRCQCGPVNTYCIVGKFGGQSLVNHPWFTKLKLSKLVLTIDNLLAYLLIRQTFFRRKLEKSQFVKLSPNQTFLLYSRHFT